MKRSSRILILSVCCLLVLGGLQAGCASEKIYAQRWLRLGLAPRLDAGDFQFARARNRGIARICS